MRTSAIFALQLGGSQLGGQRHPGRLCRAGHDHSGRSIHRARVVSELARLVVTARLMSEPKKSESALINLASGAVYYVSTSGSDSSAGSQTAPWRTIQHAATSVKAGDTVNIRSGVYNEAVTPSVSGSAAAGSITFQSYPGETAVIDGTGLKVVNGQSGLFNISGRDYITVSGLEIRNFTSKSDSQVPVGIYVERRRRPHPAPEQPRSQHHDHSPRQRRQLRQQRARHRHLRHAAPASINNLTISGNEIYHNEDRLQRDADARTAMSRTSP